MPLVVGALLLLILGALGGVALADWATDHRARQLGVEEAKLQADWEALHTAQRLHVAFMEARRHLAEEAIRHGGQRPTL
jgi:hypothetical protein